ncbi:MAG: hypothetical protein RBS40_14860 [Rhodocyclaceae bacterium]|jgi:hypothetical protein|nr:hypothetical protein [Rhodocyclaceae bacterium]
MSPEDATTYPNHTRPPHFGKGPKFPTGVADRVGRNVILANDHGDSKDCFVSETEVRFLN